MMILTEMVVMFRTIKADNSVNGIEIMIMSLHSIKTQEKQWLHCKAMCVQAKAFILRKALHGHPFLPVVSVYATIQKAIYLTLEDKSR